MTPVSSALPALLDAALRYTSQGFRVIPVHTAKGMRCSCPRNGCKTPGKHPRIYKWEDEGSVDPDKIRSWWKSWPDSNVGIVTGGGLCVIDLDPDKGGEEAFSALVASHTALPTTPESVTGSGGRHILFRYEGELRNSVQGIADGVDIRADGGLFVAPPSLHATGRQYEWASGRSIEQIPIAPLPGWLHTLIKAHSARRTRRLDPEAPIPDGSRNDTLTSLAGLMRAKGIGESAILAAMLDTNAQRCQPPLDEVEVKGIVSSIMRYKPGTWSGQVRDDGTPDREGRLDAEGRPVAPPLPDAGHWEMELTFTPKGMLDGENPGNAALLIGNLPEWRGCLQFNAFGNRIVWVSAPPPVAGLHRPIVGTDIQDHHILYVQQWLARQRGTRFGKGAIQDACIAAARNNSIHPLQDYLNSLRWDGAPRLSRWMTTYLGAEPNDYTKAVGEWWMISAVARAMQPGCQVDHMLILEGRQGAGKSTAARILAGDWFLGSLPDLRGTSSKEAADALNGHWIVEMGELDAMRGATLTKTKDFLSQPADTYRAAYARFKETHKRSCVFIGTTNEHNYLRDASGARRFWPVRVTRLSRDQLIRDRNQLCAEAKYMYDNGATWHPTPEQQTMLQGQQDQRFDVDPWEEIVAVALDDFEQSEIRKQEELKGDFKPTPLTTSYILERCLEIKAAVLDRAHSNRLAAIMHRIGWESRLKRFESPGVGSDNRTVAMRVWVRTDPTKDVLQPLCE